MSFGELLIGLIIFQAVTVWVCYFVLTTSQVHSVTSMVVTIRMTKI
jgi:hypothetical protein